GRAEAVGHRGPPSLVLLVQDHLQLQVRVGGHEVADDLARGVAAHVVDEEDLEGTPHLDERVPDLREALPERLFFVVAGEDDADLGGGGPPLRPCTPGPRRSPGPRRRRSAADGGAGGAAWTPPGRSRAARGDRGRSSGRAERSAGG